MPGEETRAEESLVAAESQDASFGSSRGRLRALSFLTWICPRITNRPSISTREWTETTFTSRPA